MEISRGDLIVSTRPSRSRYWMYRGLGPGKQEIDGMPRSAASTVIVPPDPTNADEYESRLVASTILSTTVTFSPNRFFITGACIPYRVETTTWQSNPRLNNSSTIGATTGSLSLAFPIRYDANASSVRKTTIGRSFFKSNCVRTLSSG